MQSIFHLPYNAGKAIAIFALTSRDCVDGCALGWHLLISLEETHTFFFVDKCISPTSFDSSLNPERGLRKHVNSTFLRTHPGQL